MLCFAVSGIQIVLDCLLQDLSFYVYLIPEVSLSFNLCCPLHACCS